MSVAMSAVFLFHSLPAGPGAALAETALSEANEAETNEAAADEKGLADLDKATQLQLSAETLGDLEKVIQHCEQALEKGLNDENTKFAKELLGSTLFDHARRLSASIFEQQPPSPRWPVVRKFALDDLNKAIKHQPDNSEALLLIARLQALPGGDRKAGRAAADGAVKQIDKADKKELSKALVIRGQLSEDAEEQLKDFAAAIDADPANGEAWQARALLHMSQGDNDKAISDLKKLIEMNRGNVMARFALVEALTNLKKYDDALTELEPAIKANPGIPMGYLLRARIYLMKEDKKQAIASLDEAIKAEPRDIASLLTRGQLLLDDDRFADARNDVQRVLQLRPGLPQALLLRSQIAVGEKNFGAAIADIRELSKQDPENVTIQLQIARLYIAGGWPRAGIRVAAKIIEKNPENVPALHARADALLNIGKHAEAIADYEKALKLQPDSDGVLNNLAWVLATSPDDKLRNGKRSIELGKKACEETDYKAPHILSTLAAGYAESGDFETALKWSAKAVELGEGESKEQLAKELESYKEKKPWRERQETEDKPNPPPLNDGDETL